MINTINLSINTDQFIWLGGIENTFVPQARPGSRQLDEYELTQHYTQWRADLDRAAELGVSMLRWGVPWYRVEPQRGQFDWTWIDEVLDYMVNQVHIQPVIDLMHYGTPLWLEASFDDPRYPELVATYARAFAERYGELVRFYTPLNEPTINAKHCGLRADWPPYLSGETGFVRVLLQVARGIQRTARAVREADADAVLVAVEAMSWGRAADPSADDDVAHYAQRDFIGWDLVSGAVDQAHPLYGWLIRNGATAEELAELRVSGVFHDLYGVNFYPWAAYEFSADASGEIVANVVPSDGRLLADVLRRSYAHTGRPLIITETSANTDVAGRAAWLAETLAAVREARAEGVPVVGYTWFPIITMIDWDYRLSEQPIEQHLLHLGLWDAHFDDAGTLVREATPLVEQYRAYIANAAETVGPLGTRATAK